MAEEHVNDREAVISLQGLTKRYDNLTAVDQLNLTIYRGEIFGLLGPNGAGKSTTILMMLGLTEPDAGQALVCGQDATRHPVAAKKAVGYLPDNVGFYDHMTGLENLVYIGRLNGLSLQRAKTDGLSLLERVGLTEAAHKKTGKYSRGMIQRLGLADVLIKRPEVIILDEPTLGIDPKGVKEFLELIVQLSREENITVLLSSHHLHQVQQVCDRVGIFVKGKLIAEGNITTLSNQLFPGDPYVIEATVSNPNMGAAAEALKEKILALSGVQSVHLEDDRLKISCQQDLSARIASTIVENGTGLTALAKKEYGLDEIYQRYFEKEAVLS